MKKPTDVREALQNEAERIKTALDDFASLAAPRKKNASTVQRSISPEAPQVIQKQNGKKESENIQGFSSVEMQKVSLGNGISIDKNSTSIGNSKNILISNINGSNLLSSSNNSSDIFESEIQQARLKKEQSQQIAREPERLIKPFAESTVDFFGEEDSWKSESNSKPTLENDFSPGVGEDFREGFEVEVNLSSKVEQDTLSLPKISAQENTPADGTPRPAEAINDVLDSFEW